MKLNIGAGDTKIDGFEAVDRKLGQEAYPLQYDDDSVEEIRASHILEHFATEEAPDVVRDWVRVLKPGAKIRIAVPDFEKIRSADLGDPYLEMYVYGGQTDENDFHRSAWTESKLRTVMADAGIEPASIQRWESKNTDCASLPISLNLEGRKSDQPIPAKPKRVPQSIPFRTGAVMTLPRYGSMAARGIMDEALFAFGIPLATTQGVFWGQCMQRMFESALDRVDIILTLDFDTCLTTDNLSQLFSVMAEREDIDALAAYEPRRNNDKPLMTVGNSTELRIDWSPIKVTSAHFGLTAIRTSSLRKLPKPWFHSKPDDEGGWSTTNNQKFDDDIWFWHKWREAGNTIYVDPKNRIGHQEETVAYYDDNLEIQRCSVPEWRAKFLPHTAPTKE